MRESEILLGPGVPDLAALGAGCFEDLMGDSGALEGEPRAVEISRHPGECLLRLPLPGTPDAEGRPRSRPRGAGTGHVFLRRFEGGDPGEILRARFTRPRSTSRAAREWNLVCHLRSLGVGTPEPLAVGGVRSGLFSRRSFLVTRELDGMRPLVEWMDAHRDVRQRAELARALGLALRRTFDGGLWLPRLRPRHVWVGGTEDATRPAPVPALGTSPLPEIAFTSFRGGRLLEALDGGRRVEWLARFGRELAAVHAIGFRAGYRVFLHAVGRTLSTPERRSAWDRVERVVTRD